MQQQHRDTGTITRYYDLKGFGFIAMSGAASADVFFHASDTKDVLLLREGHAGVIRAERHAQRAAGVARGGGLMCAEETLHPVTLEIAESTRDGAPSFQARARLAGIVIRDIGTPQATELEAFDVVAKALTAAGRVR